MTIIIVVIFPIIAVIVERPQEDAVSYGPGFDYAIEPVKSLKKDGAK
jgi:hypothetical protein